MSRASPKQQFDCPTCRELAQGKLRAHVRPGKQALVANHGARLTVEADCSVNIDKGLQPVRKPNEELKVFDYLVVSSETCDAHFVEVHPASSTGEVDVLIRKKAGTEQLMRRAGVEVRGEWHWLVDGEGRVNFKAGDKYGLRLRDAKIRQPQRTLKIP
ncbi:hypothetical protein [Archangium sp.]|uniref:hypothetical protein n=1 Tax=Archangium sp. TaxID=1872627 RepID=UPI002D69EB01|nr:hypothetical protein [Archangium sp.]HYO52219.1 hypothetical protein [Archangium sp.]